MVIKLLSVDPANYDDAPLEGIRRLLEHFTGAEIARGQPLDTSKIESIRMGTTVATNALLERKGEDMVMVVTKGFKDCLAIGNQSRPDIFALDIRKPEVLYKRVVEIEERVTLEDYAEDPTRHQTEAASVDEAGADAELVRGLSGETVRVLQRPQEEEVRKQLQDVFDSGIKSIAVCLMHGYTYPHHEALIGRPAQMPISPRPSASTSTASPRASRAAWALKVSSAKRALRVRAASSCSRMAGWLTLTFSRASRPSCLARQEVLLAMRSLPTIRRPRHLSLASTWGVPALM